MNMNEKQSIQHLMVVFIKDDTRYSYEKYGIYAQVLSWTGAIEPRKVIRGLKKETKYIY